MKNEAISPTKSTVVIDKCKEQKNRMKKELSVASAFLTEWFWQNVDMKNAIPFQDPDYLRQRWKREFYKQLGAPSYGYGELQKRMDKEMDGVLKRLRAEDIKLTDNDFYAFSYTAAGLDNVLIAHLLEIPKPQDVALLKHHLKNTFLRLKSPYKFEYLALLASR